MLGTLKGGDAWRGVSEGAMCVLVQRGCEYTSVTGTTVEALLRAGFQRVWFAWHYIATLYSNVRATCKTVKRVCQQETMSRRRVCVVCTSGERVVVVWCGHVTRACAAVCAVRVRGRGANGQTHLPLPHTHETVAYAKKKRWVCAERCATRAQVRSYAMWYHGRASHGVEAVVQGRGCSESCAWVSGR